MRGSGCMVVPALGRSGCTSAPQQYPTSRGNWRHNRRQHTQTRMSPQRPSSCDLHPSMARMKPVRHALQHNSAQCAHHPFIFEFALQPGYGAMTSHVPWSIALYSIHLFPHIQDWTGSVVCNAHYDPSMQASSSSGLRMSLRKRCSPGRPVLRFAPQQAGLAAHPAGARC